MIRIRIAPSVPAVRAFVCLFVFSRLVGIFVEAEPFVTPFGVPIADRRVGVVDHDGSDGRCVIQIL